MFNFLFLDNLDILIIMVSTKSRLLERFKNLSFDNHVYNNFMGMVYKVSHGPLEFALTDFESFNV